eukprot:15358534-Ditylum_brightwellii.AAC.1
MLDDFITASDYLALFVKKRPFNRRNLSSVYGNGRRSRGRRGYGGRGSWHRCGRGHGRGHGRGSRDNPIEKDKVNKLRKAFRDNKCKMAAANSDNRDIEDDNQAGNAMNCKKRSGKQD